LVRGHAPRLAIHRLTAPSKPFIPPFGRHSALRRQWSLPSLLIIVHVLTEKVVCPLRGNRAEDRRQLRRKVTCNFGAVTQLRKAYPSVSAVGTAEFPLCVPSSASSRILSDGSRPPCLFCFGATEQGSNFRSPCPCRMSGYVWKQYAVWGLGMHFQGISRCCRERLCCRAEAVFWSAERVERIPGL